MVTEVSVHHCAWQIALELHVWHVLKSFLLRYNATAERAEVVEERRPCDLHPTDGSFLPVRPGSDDIPAMMNRNPPLKVLIKGSYGA